MKYIKNFKLDLSLLAAMITKSGVVVFVFVTFLMTGTGSNAATYYVATNGSDSSSGAITQPLQTIKKGISMLKAGDTLYVRGGTYAENIDSNRMTIPTGISWTNPVTIAAYSGETVVLRPGGGGEVINLGHSYIQYLIFDSLTIDATGVQYGISTTNGAHHVRFTNVEVKNATSAGGVISSYGNAAAPSATYHEYIGMRVHDNGSTRWHHGFYISTSGNLIDQCQIFSNAGYGVHIYTGDPSKPANNNVVRNSRIYGNGSAGGTAFGIILSNGDGNLAYNNFVYNNSAGIQVGSSTNTKVYNNTIYGNTAGGYAGVVVDSGSRAAVVRNNIIYQNAGTISDHGSGTQLSNNFTTDPLFVDPRNGNFALRPGSPAVDTGALEYISNTSPVPSAPGNLVVTQ